MGRGLDVFNCAESTERHRGRNRSINTLRRHKVAHGSLEPCLLPENQATSLAAIMSRSVTAQSLEVYGVLHATDAPSLSVLTGLVRTLEYSKPAAAVLRHLRHESQVFQAATRVERRKNFSLSANLHPFSGLQVQFVIVACATRGHCILTL